MPIPILIAGLGAAAGVIIGAGGHLSAKETNERAQKIAGDAQEIYNNAKHSFVEEKNKTEKALIKLGYAKKKVLDSSMDQFLNTYDRIKHIQINESIGINELSKFTIDQQGALQLREMTNIYSSSFASGATGAAAGAALDLAASGTLPLVTSELALAGSVLAAGEIGMAAGIAGSALSFGAAETPLAAIAAPVILFTGISASLKADENLEKANAMYAEAEAAAEKMRISEILCSAITKKSEMFDALLGDLDKMFTECSKLLAGVVKKKEGWIFKKQITSEDFSEEELKLIAVTRAIAGAVKSVIDTPILLKDGSISNNAEKVYDQIVKKIPDFSQDVQEVTAIDYRVKSITEEATKLFVGINSKKSGPATGMDEARNVFAVVLGVVCATQFVKIIASSATSVVDKFLLLDSNIVNIIAIWLLLCSSVTMLAGQFKGTTTEKVCDWSSGISLCVLYVQYCRIVERMDHCVVFSIIFIVVISVVDEFVQERKGKWQFGVFLCHALSVIAMWPFMFLIYAFFVKAVGFSESFCLVVTTILLMRETIGLIKKDE